MKPSEITVRDVALYLRLNIDELSADDTAGLTAILASAKHYISHTTGMNIADLNFDDMGIAVLVLCQDAYDNRSMYVDKAHSNRIIENIIYMHSQNLL